MDLTTALGLAAGATVILTLILLGGDLRTFYDMHAAIVIFGGSFAATLIRFPLASIVGSSRVDLQACKLEYSIVSPK